MTIIPPRLATKEVAAGGVYRCPLCKVQTTADPNDPGWTRCPMLGNTPICVGCCIDHQSAATAMDFDDHPYRDLFATLSRLTGTPIPDLRRTCVQHQADLLRAMVDVADDDEDVLAVARALRELS